jgi:hypothetical protein
MKPKKITFIGRWARGAQLLIVFVRTNTMKQPPHASLVVDVHVVAWPSGLLGSTLAAALPYAWLACIFCSSVKHTCNVVLCLVQVGLCSSVQ